MIREFDQKGHGSVVVEFHRHMGSENSPRHPDVVFLQAFDEGLVKWPSQIGSGGAGKARSAPFATVSVQGELRDGQDLPLHIAHREVETALGVVEDAQASAFVGAEFDRRGPIALVYADEENQTGSDTAYLPLLYADGGAADALNQDSHLSAFTVCGCRPARSGSAEYP